MATARHLTILTWLHCQPQVIIYNGPSCVEPNQTVSLYEFQGNVIEWRDLGSRTEFDGEKIREYEVYINGDRFTFGRLYQVKRELNSWFKERLRDRASCFAKGTGKKGKSKRNSR